MNQFYAVNKKTNLLTHTAASLALIKARMQELGEKEEDFYILQDVDMKYISRIVYVDGECVYNNKEFWTKKAPTVLENFNEHEVKDFMGKPVGLYRFTTEYNSNASRISVIDGVAGEVDYNITIGNEFISLFREECIFTDFETVTPLEIAQKLMAVISLVQTGSFREAKLVLKTIENDAFLTPERIQKYEDMLDSADAITYATPEEFFYTAQENV
jgi:hypothetical protein